MDVEFRTQSYLTKTDGNLIRDSGEKRVVNASLSEPISMSVRVGSSLDASDLSGGEREAGGTMP